MEESSSSILDTIMSTKQEEELLHFRPTDVLTQLFHVLRTRERDVLTRRFGLFGHARETLEHIGKSLNVTRERIRQIERLAIETVKKHKDTGATLEPVAHVLRGILEEHGDAMEAQFLLKTALAHIPESTNEFSALRFLMSEILNDTFPHHPETNEWKEGWGIRVTLPTAFPLIVGKARQFFEERGAPVSKKEILDYLRSCSFDEVHSGTLSDSVFESALRLHEEIGENIFALWGLKRWPTITPKRMNDKIFLVLTHEGKPLHFQDITKKINDLRFDKKAAHPATIHNELILDKRYVLVGRGLYALKSWGYRPGVVADIIEAILRDAGTPMKRADIIAAVLKERFVAESTVTLALTHKEKFERLPDGRYQLRQSDAPTQNVSASPEHETLEK